MVRTEGNQATVRRPVRRAGGGIEEGVVDDLVDESRRTGGVVESENGVPRLVARRDDDQSGASGCPRDVDEVVVGGAVPDDRSDDTIERDQLKRQQCVGSARSRIPVWHR